MDFRTASPDRYQLLKTFARQNRRNATLAESVLWQQLRERPMGAIFLRQHIIGDYIVDFVTLNKKLIIEVDGAYHAEPMQQENDTNRTEALNKMGFQVIRFTNEEVMYNTNEAIQRITNYLT